MGAIPATDPAVGPGRRMDELPVGVRRVFHFEGSS
jgi:hypothetical protein